MHAAADAHIAAYRWPDDCAVHALTAEQLEKLLRETYLAANAAGRESTRSPEK